MRKISDSRVVGGFYGWAKGQLYKLEDGTAWRLDETLFDDHRCGYRQGDNAYDWRARATIVETNDGTTYLRVLGRGPKRRVTKMREMTTSEIVTRSEKIGNAS